MQQEQLFLNCNPNITRLHFLEIVELACYLFLGTIRTSFICGRDSSFSNIFTECVCILLILIAFLVCRFSVCIYELILVCICLCIWIRGFLHVCDFRALPLLPSPMYVQCVNTWDVMGETNFWGQKSCLLLFMSQFLHVSMAVDMNSCLWQEDSIM